MSDGVFAILMVRALMANHDKDSVLISALGSGIKERISLTLYTAAIPLAFAASWTALVNYMTAAIMWLIPDRRIENKIGS